MIFFYANPQFTRKLSAKFQGSAIPYDDAGY